MKVLTFAVIILLLVSSVRGFWTKHILKLLGHSNVESSLPDVDEVGDIISEGLSKKSPTKGSELSKESATKGSGPGFSQDSPTEGSGLSKETSTKGSGFTKGFGLSDDSLAKVYNEDSSYSSDFGQLSGGAEQGNNHDSIGIEDLPVEIELTYQSDEVLVDQFGNQYIRL